MNRFERDPTYIADTLRLLRKTFRLTQENLADMSNLSTRTIEKAESGRRSPDEQTLRSIARVLGLDVGVFNKPTPEQEARWHAEMERKIRKTAVVMTFPVRTAKHFMDRYGEWHAWRIDTSNVDDDEAIEIAAAMGDWLDDLNGIWSMSSASQRLGYSRAFSELCQQIEQRGYICHLGQHRQRLREKGKPDLVFQVGVMSIQPKKSGDATKCALIELEGAWETLEEDRPNFQG